MRGFMDGHTQWMSDDEDDHEEVSGGAATDGNEEEGQQDNDDDEEVTTHDDGDQPQGEQHVEDADTSTPLNSVMPDPHLQQLLLNNSMTDDPRFPLDGNLSWRSWR